MLSKSAIYRIAQATLRAYAKEVNIPEEQVALQARTVMDMARIVDAATYPQEFDCPGLPDPDNEEHRAVANDLLTGVVEAIVGNQLSDNFNE